MLHSAANSYCLRTHTSQHTTTASRIETKQTEKMHHTPHGAISKQGSTPEGGGGQSTLTNQSKEEALDSSAQQTPHPHTLRDPATPHPRHQPQRGNTVCRTSEGGGWASKTAEWRTRRRRWLRQRGRRRRERRHRAGHRYDGKAMNGRAELRTEERNEGSRADDK
jgi:hypothetical protein